MNKSTGRFHPGSNLHLCVTVGVQTSRTEWNPPVVVHRRAACIFGRPADCFPPADWLSSTKDTVRLMSRGQSWTSPHRRCFGTRALMLVDPGNLQAAGSGRQAVPLPGGQASPLERRGSENPPAGGGNKS